MTAKKRGRKALKGAVIAKVIDMTVRGKTAEEITAETPIKSVKTISKIRRSKSEIIEAKKRAYVSLIDKFSSGDVKQAQRLADMLDAETVTVDKHGDEHYSPDHKARLDAIKYIDNLKGRLQPSIKATQNNIYVNKELDKYIK